MKGKKQKNMSVSQKALAARSKASKLSKQKKSSFLRDLKEEMKKVSWTTKDELTTCTKIVLGSVLTLGLGIYVVDLSLKGTLDGIRALAHLIGF